MDQIRTMPATTRTRRKTLIAAAAAGVTVAAAAGIALAAGAAAHGSTASTTAAARSASAATQSMASIWADSEPATRDYLCTAFQANPDGTWQSVAPVLAASGVTRAQAEEHLAAACSAQAGVAVLR
jgi:hypothetical protein